jgi:hypothetical protein
MQERGPQVNAKLIYCGMIQAELEAAGKGIADRESLPEELHLRPDALRQELQKAIDQKTGCDFIVLGFGLCGMAAAGLYSGESRLVIPKVDDCIQLLLGSRERFAALNAEQPGTYYLTRGFIEKKVDPLSQFHEGVKRYGWDKCLRLMKRVLSGYKRFALIDMGHLETEQDWVYTERSARLFGMEAVRIQGSLEQIEKILSGKWDTNFLIVNKGEPITREMFGY